MKERDPKAEKQAKRLLKKVDAATFGQRLKRLRIRQGLSVRALAEMANLNKNSIVRIEAGHLGYPSTIIKVCEALGIHLDRLCRGDEGTDTSSAVHRHEQDRWFDLQGLVEGPIGDAETPLSQAERRQYAEQGIETQMVLFQSRPSGGKLWPGLIELYGPSRSRAHPGEEFVYVLSGSLTIIIGNEKFDLAAGESIGFWPSEPHSYAPAKDSELPTRILCIRIDP
ncbi:MAG: cupin domain-containing protein [Armatimonadetes bacterium]|nr:cupin domain-containing protein [Armatimonadota bacterium]